MRPSPSPDVECVCVSVSLHTCRGSGCASAVAGTLPEDVLNRVSTLEEIEQEIMLRDTFELFDVEQRGGLDVELFALLLNEVPRLAVALWCARCARGGSGGGGGDNVMMPLRCRYIALACHNTAGHCNDKGGGASGVRQSGRRRQRLCVHGGVRVVLQASRDRHRGEGGGCRKS